MANDRGGLIVIGIRDEDDVAAETTPVELVDGEEGRLRQTAAGNLAPHVPFEIRVVPTNDDAKRGYYLMIVPPSSLRPHAVRQDRNLRYPRRDGTTTRWLSEAEVADMYRDRFRLATDESERMTVVIRYCPQATVRRPSLLTRQPEQVGRIPSPRCPQLWGRVGSEGADKSRFT